MKLKELFMAFGAAFVFSTAAHATPEIPARIMQHYAAAVDGDEDATEAAYEGLQVLREQHPTNPLVNTLLGSAEALMADIAWMPWTKMKYVERGMARMDKAVQLLQPQDHIDTFEGVPVSIWVKTTAGCTFIEVPEMFNRLDSGYQLLKDAIESEVMKPLPFEAQAPTYLCAGKAAKKAREAQAARTYLDSVMKGAPESIEAEYAKALLESLD